MPGAKNPHSEIPSREISSEKISDIGDSGGERRVNSLWTWSSEYFNTGSNEVSSSADSGIERTSSLDDGDTEISTSVSEQNMRSSHSVESQNSQDTQSETAVVERFPRMFQLAIPFRTSSNPVKFECDHMLKELHQRRIKHVFHQSALISAKEYRENVWRLGQLIIGIDWLIEHTSERIGQIAIERITGSGNLSGKREDSLMTRIGCAELNVREGRYLIRVQGHLIREQSILIHEQAKYLTMWREILGD